MKLVRVILIAILLVSFVGVAEASRLPTVGGDNNAWGTIMNEFLGVSLDGDGNITASKINTTHILDSSIVDADISNTTDLTLNFLMTATGLGTNSTIISFKDNGLYTTTSYNVTSLADKGEALSGFTPESMGFVQSYNSTDSVTWGWEWDNYPTNNHSVIYSNTDGAELILEANLTAWDRITFRFGEAIDNIYDGIIQITGQLNVTENIVAGGNITSENVFIPSYIRASGNSIQVATADQWYNISLNKSAVTVYQGMTHTHTGSTNESIWIQDTGIYAVSYTFAFSDSAANPAAHIGTQCWTNASRVGGSYTERDTTKQNAEIWAEHDFITKLNAGEELVCQFRCAENTVTLKSHGTFNPSPASSQVSIHRVA